MKHIIKLSLILCLPILAFTQQQIDCSLFYDGNNRTYTIYIPESYNDNEEVPLMFNFHGGAGLAEYYISEVDMRPIADVSNFILVYPQAIEDPTNGDATWMHKEPTTHDDTYFIEAIIDTLLVQYNINSDRIYACGYSNGGEFSYELACKLSDKIAAISAVARTMYTGTYNNCTPSHPLGIMTILGTADEISNYNGITFEGVEYYLSAAAVNEYWINHNNCESDPIVTTIADTDLSDGSYVERFSWADANGCRYVEELKVNGGDHDWPGVSGNMDINASQEIWDFVSKFDLNGMINCETSLVNENHQNSSKKKIAKVVDYLGRSVKTNKNQVLFYIYEDGTVEKKIIID